MSFLSRKVLEDTDSETTNIYVHVIACHNAVTLWHAIAEMKVPDGIHKKIHIFPRK